MTEELKQKAEAEADKVIIGSGMDRGSVIHLKLLLVTMYVQGATENGIQWHDLRKNPKDLPKGHKIVLNQNGMSTEYDPDRGFLGFGGCGIIAWTDVPFFKE